MDAENGYRTLLERIIRVEERIMEIPRISSKLDGVDASLKELTRLQEQTREFRESQKRSGERIEGLEQRALQEIKDRDKVLQEVSITLTKVQTERNLLVWILGLLTAAFLTMFTQTLVDRWVAIIPANVSSAVHK